MQLKYLYNYATDSSYDQERFDESDLRELIDYAMWSSEPVPFDPMEITLHKIYEKRKSGTSERNMHYFMNIL
jgi:Ca2+-transporting ATPase